MFGKELSKEEANGLARACGDQLRTLFSANAWAIYTAQWATIERKRKNALRHLAKARHEKIDLAQARLEIYG